MGDGDGRRRRATAMGFGRRFWSCWRALPGVPRRLPKPGDRFWSCGERFLCHAGGIPTEVTTATGAPTGVTTANGTPADVAPAYGRSHRAFWHPDGLYHRNWHHYGRCQCDWHPCGRLHRHTVAFRATRRRPGLTGFREIRFETPSKVRQAGGFAPRRLSCQVRSY